MNSHTLTVTEAVRHFSEYISRVTYRHESFILKKGTKSIAELRPLPTGRRLGDLPAILNSLPKLNPKEASDMEGDIETGRKELEKLKPRDPWES